MKILVINAGSSSIKYQLLDMDDESLMASGIVERIGEAQGELSHKKIVKGNEQKTVIEKKIGNHREGMHLLIDMITSAETGVIASTDEIDAIGHRVVQGGELFNSATLIDKSVKQAIEENNPLAPLHNPANLTGIAVAEELFPGTPNVAVFDTEFHQTMPARAYMYALPYEFYEDLKVRRYGFHGTSHKYVAKNVASAMNRNPEDINVITIHLGNGGSITAVKGGKCIDTSMGMTPLAGVMMGSRCGDIDPAISGYIAEAKNISAAEVDSILNKKSGFKGICGMNDMRDIHESAAGGNQRARLAVDMFCYQVKKYIGAYFAALGTVDAIAFTAGIGENDDIVRAGVCSDMEGLGLELDAAANDGRISHQKKISKDGGKVDIWVIPTNEELQIAQDTIDVVRGN
ncbi:acetate kinase [Desulfopila inferna]|uniref:acetate kinase n=1 Tax=Desulfopila inferna TaxID=468528 RepID=UPI001964A63D|nr:acetate kinase [Desulfopila inferna]MBM9603309.1 acetate kinase [Desulfopila inferna]